MHFGFRSMHFIFDLCYLVTSMNVIVIVFKGMIQLSIFRINYMHFIFDLCHLFMFKNLIVNMFNHNECNKKLP